MGRLKGVWQVIKNTISFQREVLSLVKMKNIPPEERARLDTIYEEHCQKLHQLFLDDAISYNLYMAGMRQLLAIYISV